MVPNKFKKIAVACGMAAAFSLSAQVSHAGHAIGLAYSNGMNDVSDWHEENLYVDRIGLPLGLSYRYIHDFDSDLRLDVGVSWFGTGNDSDLDYSDLPLQFTVGYSFFKDNVFKPYVRGGLSYHIMDGDYVEDEAGLGFLGALGVEIGRRGNFFAEISIDTAEATFSTDASNKAVTRTHSTEDIAVSDMVFTIGGRF
ncbi:MAG: OmpW family outer membrane protein [Gammaproteobacteria bacterium]|nr:OmpW family outer membrane protein [Gammaproteobacteria bacterium]